MKYRIIIFALFISSFVSAQNYFQIETDLMDPTTAKGGSLFLSYGFGKNIISLGSTINELPEFLNDQSDDFKEKRNFQASLEYARFFKEEARGLYLGANVNYSNISIQELSSNAEQDLDVMRFGLVLGYAWMPWKGLVINPFINPRFSTGFDDTQFGNNKTYEGETFSPFGGLKLGWRF